MTDREFIRDIRLRIAKAQAELEELDSRILAEYSATDGIRTRRIQDMEIRREERLGVLCMLESMVPTPEPDLIDGLRSVTWRDWLAGALLCVVVWALYYLSSAAGLALQGGH